MRLPVIVVAVAVAGGCIGPFPELQENAYPNRSAARSADAGGWIPPILPEDATDIREVHDVASTLTWGCFSTRRPQEVRALLGSLHAYKVSGAVAAPPTESLRDFSWWPDAMSASHVEVWELLEAARCQGCSPTTVRVGLDDKSATACFHRTG